MKHTLAVWVTSLAIGAALAFTAPAGAEQGGGGKTSVWSGVYTTAQAKRGEKIHASSCVPCHGAQLNGDGVPDMPQSPGIAGTDLLFKWSGKTVAELFEYVHKTMPIDNPGRLTEQESIDSIAHMFAVSEMPAGAKELPPDSKALANIMIERKPK